MYLISNVPPATWNLQKMSSRNGRSPGLVFLDFYSVDPVQCDGIRWVKIRSVHLKVNKIFFENNDKCFELSGIRQSYFDLEL